MKCSATKWNGLLCTFKAKANCRCGFHKISKPTPKPRGIPLQRPTPKPRVKKTALDEQPNRPVPKPRKKLRQPTPVGRPSKRNKLLREWRMEQVPEYNDLTTFLRDSQSWAHRILENELKELKSLKFQLSVQVELIKYNVEDGNILDTATPWLHTKMNVLFQPEDIEESLSQTAPRLQESLERWIRRGSNWVLSRVMNQHIDISKYRPLRARSYLPIPKEVWAKKAIVNVKNQDNDCLRWSLRAALFPVDKNSERTTKYPLNDNLNFKGVDAPTPLSILLY